jgi:uncharacterized protein YjiS (DUF1127 family)
MEIIMFNKIIKAIARTQERRAAYFVLQHMTDKQLKDIGVTRGELRQRVYGD